MADTTPRKEVRAVADIRRVPFMPANEFQIPIFRFYSAASWMAVRPCLSWYSFASSPSFPLRMTDPASEREAGSFEIRHQLANLARQTQMSIARLSPAECDARFGQALNRRAARV